MCGITGIIHKKNQPISNSELEKMSNLVAHRGPDDAGMFVQQNVGLAHRRLSIIDLSKNGKQPMQFQNLVLTFNGEIYNYLEIKQELIAAGYEFTTETDTEVILQAYAHWGKYCVEHFNGMWAFAILDLVKKELFCSRDRFGIKPFYYTEIEGKFCFASEIKQFSAVKGWKPKLNKLRAYEFLHFGWHDHTSETFFEQVFQLPQGSNLLYDLKSHEWQIEKYYDLATKINSKSSPTLSEKVAISTFQKLFTESINLRLRADVKTGSALSGGLDSSSIVGIVTQVANPQVADTSKVSATSDATENSTNSAAKNEVADTLEGIRYQEAFETVSACFEDQRFDESEYVDAVVQRSKIQLHKVFPRAEQLWDSVEKITYHQDEPIASASVFAQYLVFEKAAEQGIKVMLDGQGADEILAGYDKFYAPYFKRLLQKNPLLAVKEFFHYWQLHSTSLSEIFTAISFSVNTEICQFFKPEFLPTKESIFHRSSEKTVQDCSKNLLFEIGLPILLHYEDRNSMAHSVESRVPFLDYRLVEFCLNLPDKLKIKNGKRKYILRESMKDVLPKKVYERYDKMGFVTPQVIWMEANSEWILERISAAVQRDNSIFDNALIAYATAVFKEKKREDYAFLWRVLAFEVWNDIFEIG